MPETERRKAAEQLVIQDEFLAGIMALISTVRDSALLEAAGLVCNSCKNGRPIVKEAEYWVHPERKDHTEPFMCAAYKIHERRALKGNG